MDFTSIGITKLKITIFNRIIINSKLLKILEIVESPINK
jgi:hypothetical protein